jgi:hypothetical protein
MAQAHHVVGRRIQRLEARARDRAAAPGSGRWAPWQKFVFESPVVRLLADYQYQSVYQNGLDILDDDWKPSPDETGKDVDGIPSASIIIYRYYDTGSELLGDGKSRRTSRSMRRA